MSQDLAAEALALRLTAGHHARRGRYDGNAHAAEHSRHLRLARVDPKARLADAADTRDRGQLADELQPNDDLARVRLLVAGDEALVAQDARDLQLRPPRRAAHGLMPRARGVADAREHVGHRVVRHPDALRPGFLGRRRGLARRSVGPGLPGLLAHAAHLLFGQHAHLYLPHQLDFVTPGNSPISARSRKQIRHRPNIRMYPRGRPQISQRWCARTLNLGVRRDFRMRLFFAIDSLSGRGTERHPEAAQQCASLFVRSRRRHDRDLHAAQAIDLVIVDLREDELLFEPEREVASAVEALVRHSLEVADARERDGDELLEEVPHPLAAKRDLEPDRHPDAKAEVRDGLSRLRDDRALPGDRREVSRCGVHRLRVADRLAHSDVEDDLLDLRDLHHVRVAELLAQLVLHGLVIPLFQHGGHDGSSTTIASPHCRHTRSFVPSSSRRWPMRVGLPQCGQTTMTLPSPSGIGWSTIPPFWFLEGFGLVWRLAMLTPATMTVCALGRTSCTRPRLPRSFPVMTITSSPLRSRMPAISKHLRRERDDLHEVPLAELACDGSEDACPAGLVLRVEQNGGVIVEADHRPVGAAILLRLADHDRAHYLALLHTGVRDRVLHCRDEHITDLRRRTRRRAQHADHRELTRSGVVGATDPGVRPDHSSACSSS